MGDSTPFPSEPADRSEVERLRALPYADYLQSEHWKTTRRVVVWDADFRCQLCNTCELGQPWGLHVHHRTYERLGYERRQDLIALCPDCHARFHDKLLAQTAPVPYKSMWGDDEA